MNQLEDLVTGAEIARRLDISRSRAHQLADRDDFPQPLGRIGTSDVYRWRDVEAWARKARLPGRGRPRQPELETVAGGVRFRTIPDQPGFLEIEEANGAVTGAVAWIGSPIVALAPDRGDSVRVRTARSEGRIRRNAKGSWALAPAD